MGRMIIDSSAIVAIFLQEAGYEAIVQKLEAANELGISTPTLVECSIVLSARLELDARGLLSRFLQEANITVVPFTEQHARIAVGAWRKFGKGRHPASLTYGDCISYAVAHLAKMPLLYVGDDFPKTDLMLA